jgi:hypothetical protein
MPCEEWRTLLEDCYEAETTYTQALANSCGLVGPELDQALQRADVAREVSQVCEKALLHHEEMHDCVRRSAAAKAG